MEERIITRPPSANPFANNFCKNVRSRASSINGSTTHSTNGTITSSGGDIQVTKTSLSVPIKLSKECQAKFIEALRAKGGESLNGNAIELFSAESGGDSSLLETLKAYTDRRITKCSFVFPEKVINV